MGRSRRSTSAHDSGEVNGEDEHEEVLDMGEWKTLLPKLLDCMMDKVVWSSGLLDFAVEASEGCGGQAHEDGMQVRRTGFAVLAGGI